MERIIFKMPIHMTLKEANQLLDQAPSDDKPCRCNKGLTRAQAVDIVRRGINDGRWGPDDILDPLMEKRVLQMHQNRVRPTYP